MVKVKICGLTNLGDARHAADCGADLLGFVLVAGSPRCVAPTRVAEIISELRAVGCTADMVGVFMGQERAAISAIARRCGLNYAQLHGDESPDYARALGIPVIIARRVAGRIPWTELAAYDAAAYLLDGFKPGVPGGAGVAWDWRLLADAPAGLPLILAGGLTPANVAEAIATGARLGASPWAVDVSSGVERAPGLKDPDRVRAFIKAAKGAIV